MDAVPTPILTKILYEESERVCTLEIRELVWQNICDALMEIDGNGEAPN